MLRAHARAATLCALLAMLVQLFTVASHVHLNHPTTLAKSAIAHLDPSQSVDVSADIAAASAKPAPRGDGDALCPQCLAGHLVATVAMPVVAALALPVAYGRRDPPLVTAHHTPFDLATAFWSRGPPQS